MNQDNLELHLDALQPYILVSLAESGVEGRVEDALARHRLTVGDNWWCSDPSQKQPDGRWLLYVYRP